VHSPTTRGESVTAHGHDNEIRPVKGEFHGVIECIDEHGSAKDGIKDLIDFA